MRNNDTMNTLYYGDCLTIMENMMEAGSVDLIYHDPPFNSKRDYNAIYKDEAGRPLPHQIEAFKDTWQLDTERGKRIRELPKRMGQHGINNDRWIFNDDDVRIPILGASKQRYEYERVTNGGWRHRWAHLF